MNNIVVYHNNCADGFSALWASVRFLDNSTQIVPGNYKDPAIQVTEDDHVYLVDFSYKHEQMRQLCLQAGRVTVLDHHKSAFEDLKGLDEEVGNLDLYFDMDRSGAMITWDYFFPNEQAPALMEYIQDRDLWKFELLGSHEVAEAIFSYPYSLVTWDVLMKTDPSILMKEGAHILRYKQKCYREILNGNHIRDINFGGIGVPIVNLPYHWASDALNEICKGEFFTAAYTDKAETRQFHLRSEYPRGRAMDVSKIASAYGGGGHERAAGFEIHFDDLASLGLW